MDERAIRAEFEKWADVRGMSIMRCHGEHGYIESYTDHMWTAWRAALAALTTTPEYQALVADADRKECFWTSDGDDSPWEGSCGVAWMFIDGGPEENQMAYCPQCGGKLTAQTYDEVASEDATIDTARAE